MGHKDLLLPRLDAIAVSLAQSGNALALLGLGSVGLELDRLDDSFDLDFFAIVKLGHKRAFIDNLDWMERVYPVAYTFKNTPDGYKLMYADGVFCEFAVFEPDEMAHIPFAAGRIVWKADAFDHSVLSPASPKAPKTVNVEWQVGEAITNLYIGLCRYRRGEKLSAARFVQGYAVDRVIELSALVETEQNAHKDPFTGERRYEQRFPLTATHLSDFMQGYERTPQSAKAILDFLEQYFTLNSFVKSRIIGLYNEIVH